MNKKLIVAVVIAAVCAGGAYFKLSQGSAEADIFGGAFSLGNPEQGKTQAVPEFSLDAKDLAPKKPAQSVVPPMPVAQTPAEKPAPVIQPPAPKPAVKAPEPAPVVQAQPTSPAAQKEFEELRHAIKSLSLVVKNQGDELVKLREQLNKSRNAAEIAQAQACEIKQPNVGKLIPLTPTEYAYTKQMLPKLPEVLTPHNYNVSLEQCHRALQTGGIDEVLQSFLLLSAQGMNGVHLCIGAPAPRNRPVWIEVHGQGKITLLAKNLPYEAYKGIATRGALPQLFQMPAYMLRYEANKLQIYKLCEKSGLQNY